MCPGGQIVAAVNQPGLLCTNGMSNSRHSSGWANAALVVTLGPRELGPGTWAGVAFQEALEAAAFSAGGSDYTAPAQRAPDFLAGRETRSPGGTSYRFGVRSRSMPCFAPGARPAPCARALTRIPASPRTRACSSASRRAAPAPACRATRTRAAPAASNLYPAGEGAGYAADRERRHRRRARRGAARTGLWVDRSRSLAGLVRRH
jgi:hypothetical protein